MRVLLFVAVGLLTACGHTARAQPPRTAPMTTSTLVKHCHGSDERRLTCVAYINGVADSLFYRLEICPPVGTKIGQMVDVALGWIARRNDPSFGKVVAASAVAAALLETYPCPTPAR